VRAIRVQTETPYPGTLLKVITLEMPVRTTLSAEKGENRFPLIASPAKPSPRL